MRTAHTTKSIEDYLNDFAGRTPDEDGYDAAKPVKIAEENRDFVWDEDRQIKFIVSILSGFPVPQMVICDNLVMDGGNRSTVLMKWRLNKYSVKVDDWEGNYSAMTPLLAGRWNRCAIPMTIITGATKKERSQIYENYNSGVVMTTGSLLWNRKYLPLAEVAIAMIGQGGQFPFADLIHQVWRRSWKKTKTRNEIAFAYSIVVASMLGPDFFHTKFHYHLDRLLNTQADKIDLSNLHFICGVVRSADPDDRVAPKKKEHVFKKFIGAMIYDVHILGKEQFEEKWRVFCIHAYTIINPQEMKEIIDVGTARATNQSRIQCLARKVDEFNAGTLRDEGGSDYTEESSDEEN